MKRYDDPMEMREDFSALLDGELTAEEREAMEARLGESAESLREIEAFRRVDMAYRGLARPNAPANFEQRLQRAISSPEKMTHAIRGRSRRWHVPMALAAGAAVVVSLAIALQAVKPDPIRIARMPEESAPAASVAMRAQATAPSADVAGAEFADEALTSLGYVAEEATPATPEAGAMLRERREAVAQESGADDLAEADSLAKQAAPSAAAMAPAPELMAAETPALAFALVDDVWIQEGYADERLVTLERDSDAVEALAQTALTVRAYLLDPKARIFRVEGVWYRLNAAKNP